MANPHAFDKSAAQQIVRTVRDHGREIVNLKNRLNSTSVHRHEATWLPPDIVFVRLAETVGPNSSEDFIGREGDLVFFNSATGNWESLGKDAENIVSCFFDMPNDAGEILPCVRHRGQLVPIWVRSVRHAITVTVDGDYPLEGSCPNTYGIKFVRLPYLEEPGRNEPDVAYLEPGTEYDDLVLNLFEGETSYLPEGSLVSVYSVNTQWYTYSQTSESVCDSSSSSSSSNSSDSSSGSSNSSSSGGSSESSSASSGESSSSGDSSSSGVSSSSVSGSDQSSSESVSDVPECPGPLPDDPTLIDGYSASGDLVLGLRNGCWIFRPLVNCA